MTQTTSSPSILNRLIPGLLFGFLVFVVLALAGDLRQVGGRVRAFHWELYPLVLGLTLFNYTLRFGKWHFYLRQIGAKDISIRESARLFVGGFPLAVTPGKVGEVLKAVWIQQKTGIPAARGVAVVVAERISDGLAVLFLSTVGVISAPRYWPAFAAVLALLLGIVVVSQVRPLALYLLGVGERLADTRRVNQRLPVVKRFVHALREFYEGSFTLFRPTATLLAVGLGMVSWLGEGAGLYLILRGLGVASGWQTFSAAVFALSFSIVIGAASTLPGGLGASEASIAGMLALLLSLPADTAAAATLLIRLATLWFGVSLGLGVWAVSREMLGMGGKKND
jgi:glycosyltransferase 2 family protein